MITFHDGECLPEGPDEGPDSWHRSGLLHDLEGVLEVSRYRSPTLAENQRRLACIDAMQGLLDALGYERCERCATGHVTEQRRELVAQIRYAVHCYLERCPDATDEAILFGLLDAERSCEEIMEEKGEAPEDDVPPLPTWIPTIDDWDLDELRVPCDDEIPRHPDQWLGLVAQLNFRHEQHTRVSIDWKIGCPHLDAAAAAIASEFPSEQSKRDAMPFTIAIALRRVGAPWEVAEHVIHSAYEMVEIDPAKALAFARRLWWEAHDLTDDLARVPRYKHLVALIGDDAAWIYYETLQLAAEDAGRAASDAFDALARKRQGDRRQACVYDRDELRRQLRRKLVTLRRKKKNKLDETQDRRALLQWAILDALLEGVDLVPRVDDDPITDAKGKLVTPHTAAQSAMGMVGVLAVPLLDQVVSGPALHPDTFFNTVVMPLAEPALRATLPDGERFDRFEASAKQAFLSGVVRRYQGEHAEREADLAYAEKLLQRLDAEESEDR